VAFGAGLDGPVSTPRAALFSEIIMPKQKVKPTGKLPNRRRKTLPRLPRQAEQKLVSRPTQMARVEIVTQLHDTVAACEELFRAHGPACSCDLCCLVSNFVGDPFSHARRGHLTLHLPA